MRRLPPDLPQSVTLALFPRSATKATFVAFSATKATMVALDATKVAMVALEAGVAAKQRSRARVRSRRQGVQAGSRPVRPSSRAKGGAEAGTGTSAPKTAI